MFITSFLKGASIAVTLCLFQHRGRRQVTHLFGSRLRSRETAHSSCSTTQGLMCTPKPHLDKDTPWLLSLSQP